MRFRFWRKQPMVKRGFCVIRIVHFARSQQEGSLCGLQPADECGRHLDAWHHMQITSVDKQVNCVVCKKLLGLTQVLRCESHGYGHEECALRLEKKEQADKTWTDLGISRGILLSPIVDEDYWRYRVVLSDSQAVLGFPKFDTCGIGFAREEDWNLNFPYWQSTEKVFNHIKRNKGDDNISDEDCLAAIRLIQEAAREDECFYSPEDDPNDPRKVFWSQRNES